MGLVVLDAYPLVALLGGEASAPEVELLLRQGECAITAVNLAEALDVLERRDRIQETELRKLVDPLLGQDLGVIAVSAAFAWRAASLRARHYERRRAELSLADCFLLAAAQPGDTIATADPAVAQAARAEGIELVALPDSRGRRP